MFLILVLVLEVKIILNIGEELVVVVFSFILFLQYVKFKIKVIRFFNMLKIYYISVEKGNLQEMQLLEIKQFIGSNSFYLDFKKE